MVKFRRAHKTNSQKVTMNINIINIPQTIKDCNNDLNQTLQALYNPDSETLNLVWSLDSSVAPLLKLFPENLLDKLYKKGRTYTDNFKIFYSKGKSLTLQKINPFTEIFSIYELAQYLPEKGENNSLGFFDITILYSMGEELLKALKTIGINEPKKLSTPVACYADSVLQYMNLPTVYDCPQEAAEYAYRCSGRLWTEAYKIGYFKEAYDYDLSSAFPTALMNLPDFRFGKWIKSSSFIDNAFYGFYHGIINIYEGTKINPIIYECENGSLDTRTGKREDIISKPKLDFILKYGIGDIKLFNAWYWIPTSLRFPLRRHIKELIELKKHNNPIVSNLAKRISVGIYGKMGENFEDKFGKFFNPVWFCYTSDLVTVEIARFIYDLGIQDNIIHISTDGILINKELNI